MTETPNFRPHVEVCDALDALRCAVHRAADGKHVRRPAHMVTRDAWATVQRHLESRGEFFRVPHPYYFDRVDARLIPLSRGDAQYALLLRSLGLLAEEPLTRIISANLLDHGRLAPLREVSRLAHSTDSAIYIRASETRMIKVASDSITEVPLGTDGVILLADDLGDWPLLADLQPHIDSLRSLVGDTCTRRLPGLPITDLLTARWSHESRMSYEQAHQMFVARLLFTAVASRYSLWPLLLHTGDGNTSKSTPLELTLTLLQGAPALVKAFPGKDGDLIASITSSTLLAYDNVDGARLDSPDKSSVSDLICHLSTGAEIDLRRLYGNNQRDKYKVKAHGFFTARVVPFNRPDVLRRTIHLEMDPPHAASQVDKGKLIESVLSNRSALLAEFLLRSQNILRAHQGCGDREIESTSSMPEYERYTLICAMYEGSLDETRALWEAYTGQLKQALTETNSMVFAARLWLGKSGNAGRQVSPATLFAEVQAVHVETQQSFAYRSPAAFGRHVNTNLPPLRAIGFDKVRTRNGFDYVFWPSADELAGCTRLYADLVAAAGLRPAPSLSWRKPTEPHNTPDLDVDDEVEPATTTCKKESVQ